MMDGQDKERGLMENDKTGTNVKVDMKEDRSHVKIA